MQHRFHWLLVVVTLAAIAPQPAQAAPIASSTFGTTNEAWGVVSTLGYTGSATWTATGGNPAGFIYAQDPDIGAFGFAAPSKFLGDVSAAYGQGFSFDVASYDTPSGPTAWVGLLGGSGGGVTLVSTYAAPTSVYPAWHARSMLLVETDGWIDLDSGLAATQSQMLDVLGNLDALIITAEFVEGLETDISGLDNVVLMPEPATVALLSVGLAGLVLRRKRT
jgi:Laminin B (Domain IV)/PEP-CTERM motif